MAIALRPQIYDVTSPYVYPQTVYPSYAGYTLPVFTGCVTQQAVFTGSVDRRPGVQSDTHVGSRPVNTCSVHRVLPWPTNKSRRTAMYGTRRCGTKQTVNHCRELRLNSGPLSQRSAYRRMRARSAVDGTRAVAMKKCGDSLEDHLRCHVT